MQKGFIILLAFVLFVSCNDTTSQNDSVAEAKPTNVSVKASPNDLPPVYERFEDLAPIFQQQTDTTYVINFWATWCAPCVKELPYFEALQKKYLSEKVKVILVSLDFKKQLETKLKPFLEERKLTSSVVVLLDPDANTWVDKVSPEWSGAIPATIVYKKNKKGFFEQSFEDLEELETIITPFL